MMELPPDGSTLDLPQKRGFAVFTSGGDAPGMNAAVRAVVRAAHDRGVEMFAVFEGYQGMVDGGDSLRPLSWDDVGGILHQGGTVIGSARCAAFRERSGRLRAAKNLVERGIDGLVAIGGDGTLTGANLFRQEWPGLLQELVEKGEISAEVAGRHPWLQIVGLVGSIDNDMFGTDMTIGADTALHRIVTAVDAIISTAASHHRTFIIEVMGRHCGYLALMSGLATGANWVFLPERPPKAEQWEQELCRALKASRNAGRRHGVVVVAEGAQDQDGRPITAQIVREVLETRMKSDARITILGHVQRGGSPSAFDRCLSTILGYEAIHTLLSSSPEEEPKLLGIKRNRVVTSHLMDCVKQTNEVAAAIGAKDFDRALELRGESFAEAWHHLRTLLRARPRASSETRVGKRIAIIHVGGPAPGMNTALRAAVRLAIDAGHTVLGIENGFEGLFADRVKSLDWMSVHGLASRGGTRLGTARRIPEEKELRRVAQMFEQHGIDGLLVIGGWSGYLAAYRMRMAQDAHPALQIPIVCIPASIDNNLPGSEYSLGSDTALNCIMENVDRIKQSAVASHRCFVVEVMGRDCGYLALMAGISTGAERVYIPEEGISLADLEKDVSRIVSEFRAGKRLGLFIRSECSDAWYTTDFIARLFEKEGLGYYDVRQSILGHTQQGGNPTPYDRIQAIRLASHAVRRLGRLASENDTSVVALGLQGGKVTSTELHDFPSLADPGGERPKDQNWLNLRKIAKVMARKRTSEAEPDDFGSDSQDPK
jgi:6-phosphofructokinase 1